MARFYDKTDGVTIETALTITNERITLTADTDAGSAPTLILDNVAGATSGTANDLNYITNNDAGLMQLELSASDTNRLGRMFLTITDAANHVPVFHEFMVMPALVYDTFFASSGGATFPAATLASTTNITAGTVTTATNVTTVNGLAANVITAASIAADAITAAKIATGAIDADALAADAVAEIADGVWDEDATGHQTQGTFGQAIGDPVLDTNTIFKAVVTDATGATVGVDAAAILADTGTDGVVVASINANAITATAIAADAITAAKIATGAIDADAIADNAIDAGAIATGAITSTKFAAGAITATVIADAAIDSATFVAGTLLDAAGITAAVWDADATAHQTQGTFGQAIGDPAADTNTIYKATVTDASGATVGADSTAIKAKTDQLTFTVANQVDANAESMNATTILGTGAAGDLWRG